MIEGLRGQPVRLDHERDVGRLHGDLDVVETDLIEVGELHRADSTSASGVAPPYFLYKLGCSEPAFTPMRIGTPRSRASEATSLISSGLRRFPGSTGAVNSGFEGSERHLIVEVHVGHDGHRRAGDDYREAFGRLLLVARATHDVAPAAASAYTWARVPSVSAVFSPSWTGPIQARRRQLEPFLPLSGGFCAVRPTSRLFWPSIASLAACRRGPRPLRLNSLRDQPASSVEPVSSASP